MAINLPDLPNGLKLLNSGITPGDRLGDNLPTLAQKFNYNMALLLSRQDNLAGTGLVWDSNTAKLSLAELPEGYIRVGTQTLPFDTNEFTLEFGKVNLKEVPGAKVVGQLDLGVIPLSNNSVLVGNTNGTAGEALLSDEFKTTNNTFAIDAIDFSKLENVVIPPNLLQLGNSVIPVGNSSGFGRAVTLGPDFVITTNNTLALATSDNYVTIDNIQAEGDPTLGKILSIGGTEEFPALAWTPPVEALETYIKDIFKLEDAKYEFYVNGDTGDDSLDNRGVSQLTPFKTIQRALIEVVRRSYVAGRGVRRDEAGTDLFDRAVIYISPGTYEVDNSPGSASVSAVPQYNSLSTINPADYPNYNSVNGGVVIPRGVSLVGSDLRKTKIYAKYVPDSATNATATAIFRVTGGAYFTGLTFIDNPTVTKSHHKLTCIEFPTQADLDLYYNKIFRSFSTINSYSSSGGENLQAAEVENAIGTNTSSPTALDITNVLRINDTFGASPYLNNCSVRSRYGLNGILADGSKVTGLKSILASHVTCVSLQGDNNAFEVDLSNAATERKYKTGWEHYSFKAINEAYIQTDSCYSVGSALHYTVESGAEMVCANCTSNFGGISLFATGKAGSAIPQDTGLSIVRVIPPEIINTPTRELIVGSLDTERVTTTSVGLTQLEPSDPVEFTPNTFIYVRTTSPVDQSQLDLQARLVSTGIPLSGSSSDNWAVAVINGTTNDDRNDIHKYLNVLAPYVFETTWYNRDVDPDYLATVLNPSELADRLAELGGIAKTYAAQLAEESSNRKAVLANADIFVQRVLDERSFEDQHYLVIIQIPPDKRPPTENFLINHPLIQAGGNNYFVSGVTRIPNEDLNTLYGILPGTFYQFYLLRADRPEESALTANQKNFPDAQADIGLSSDYVKLTASIDPRVYPNLSSRAAFSYDINDTSYKALVRFLTDLGYTAPEIAAVATPTAGLTTITRSVPLPNKLGVYVDGQLTVSLLRPSTIRANAHNWEWVGYQNYNTGLPRYQEATLNPAQALAAMESFHKGGRVYATGMNEVGDYFLGNILVNLKTGSESTVRFDSTVVENATLKVPKSLSELDISGRLTAQQVTASQLEVSGSITFSTSSRIQVRTGSFVGRIVQGKVPPGVASTFTEYGLTRLATTEEAKAGKVAQGETAVAVTPRALRSFASGYLSSIIKGITRLRVSLFPDTPYPKTGSSSTLYVWPFEGSEVSTYDVENDEWVILPIKPPAGSNAMSFPMAQIPVTNSNGSVGTGFVIARMYDIYVYNAGTYNNPVLGLYAVQWANNTTPPSRDMSLGIPTRKSPTNSSVPNKEADREYRLVATLYTTGANASSIKLGGIYNAPADPNTAIDYPKVYLSNYYNQYDIPTRFFFGTSWTSTPVDNGWYQFALPPAYGLNARCSFIQAKPQLVTVFMDVYSNEQTPTTNSAVYVVPGMTPENARLEPGEFVQPITASGNFSQTIPSICLPSDAFYGEATGNNQTATSCWARTMREGYHDIFYIFRSFNAATNIINEHASHGMIVLIKC